MTAQTAPMHGGDNAPPWMAWYRATNEAPTDTLGAHAMTTPELFAFLPEDQPLVAATSDDRAVAITLDLDHTTSADSIEGLHHLQLSLADASRLATEITSILGQIFTRQQDHRVTQIRSTLRAAATEQVTR